MSLKKRYYVLIGSIVFLVPVLFLATNLLLFFVYFFLSKVFSLGDSFQNSFFYASIFTVYFGLLLLLIFFSAKSINHVLYKINQMNKTIKKLSLEEVPEKLHITNDKDEIDLLAGSINRLIDRLAYKELALESELAFKKEYTNKLSHDINTPLTGLKLEIYHLEKKGQIEKASLDSMYHKIDYISKLMIQLNQRELESVKDTYIFYEDVDMREVIKKLIKKWTYIYENKDIQINLHFQTSSIIWRSNELWLERIFDNIFQNTHLHSDAKSINIHANEVNIIIMDDGKGFDTDDIQNGLGISIIKEICEKLAIHCELTSNEHGTRYMLDVQSALS